MLYFLFLVSYLRADIAVNGPAGLIGRLALGSLRFSPYIFVQSLYTSVEGPLISRLAGLETLGLYTQLCGLCGYLRRIISPFTSTIMPALCNSLREDDVGRRGARTTLARVTLYAIAPLSALVLFMPETLGHFVWGRRWDAAIQYIPALVTLMLLQSLADLRVLEVSTIHGARFLVLLELPMRLTSFLAMVVLVPLMGAGGAVLGYALGQAMAIWCARPALPTDWQVVDIQPVALLVARVCCARVLPGNGILAGLMGVVFFLSVLRVRQFLHLWRAIRP